MYIVRMRRICRYVYRIVWKYVRIYVSTVIRVCTLLMNNIDVCGVWGIIAVSVFVYLRVPMMMRVCCDLCVCSCMC
jgi:hypothetical protein